MYRLGGKGTSSSAPLLQDTKGKRVVMILIDNHMNSASIQMGIKMGLFLLIT